jgi:hypothetical protein
MMMRYVAVFFVALLVFSFLAPTGAAQIRLNEILADPASDWDGDSAVDSKLDEWVEVVNVGTSAVDLTAYRITDESAGTAWRFALGGTLSPGQVLVVYGSDVVAWQSANGVSTFGLSLNNSGDTVYLYSLAPGDTSVADSYTYGSAETRDDRSIGRLPSGSGGWVVFDGLNPYSGSALPPTGCSPSPGTGLSCATPVEQSSWGRLKSLYRN